MRRALAGLLAMGCLVLASAPLDSQAKQCSFCGQEVPEGTDPINELKCPSCVETANRITRGNERMYVLDFQPGPIGRVQIKDDTGDTEVYWFLPYTLTNRDEHPHTFFMDISAESDRGRHVFRYHDAWVPDLEEEVRRVLGVREGAQLLTQRELCMPPPGQQNQLPKVSDPRTRDTAVIALPVIQQGETLRCVALFDGFDPEMDRLTIFIRGLTPSSILTHDDYLAPDDKPHRRVVTEAVLTLHYRRPGDEFAHGMDPLEYVGRRWTDVTRVLASDLR